MTGAQKRIAIAVIFAAGIISTALFLRSDRQAPTTTPTETVAVVRSAPERKAILEEDSNNDGVPDWQEALQKTEPLQVTGEADENYTPPDTLTEQFALDFFENMVRAENYGDFGDSPDELVASAGNNLEQEAYDVLLDTRDIIVTEDNSKQALTVYGESIARIIITAPATEEGNEAAILERALRNQNPDELAKLDSKLEAYRYMLEQTLATPVPSSITKQHLDLANTYKALITDIEAMQDAFADPMMALLRMKRYQDDADGLYASIANLYNALINRGISWPENSVVFSVISIDENN